ncbi:Biopolymer transport protein ExbD/TolR [Phycisphaerae bacterium RAS1]|nr:Biopolymer transport protein ExbD/TolR [Phycisphaerae bacterium RAS1]
MKFRPPKPFAMTLNLAPMVDVMMCLIVFFLLATRLVDVEHQPILLPYAEAAATDDRHDAGPEVVINVRLSKSGDPDTPEFVVADWDGKRIVERLLQPADVDAYLAGRASQASRDGERVRCVIRADRHVMYQHVEVVLRACGLSKISDVVFSANAGREPEATP